MKLKLTYQNAQALMHVINEGASSVRFITEIERRFCAAILKTFVTRVAKKMLEKPEQFSIKLDDSEVLVLHYTLPQMPFHADPLTLVHLDAIINDLDLAQQCIS